MQFTRSHKVSRLIQKDLSEIFLSETESNRLVPLPQGSHAFSKLLFQPMKKQAQRVAEKMANEYIKITRMVA